MARLRDKYRQEVVPEMMKRFGYKNRLEVPRIEKIVVNMGIGAAVQDAKYLEDASRELSIITGQRPVPTKAKKSISNFKLRAGAMIGCKVTLRRSRMYEFFDRLVNVALPRIRDFRGLSTKSFDGRGNYTFGLSEQSVFPEVDMDKIKRVQGMDISIVTTSRTDEETETLLDLMGIPFSRK